MLSKVGEESPSETKLVIPAQLSEIELLLIGAATQYQPHANPPQWKDVTKAIAHIQILRTNMSWRDASSAQNVVSALGELSNSTRRMEPAHASCINLL